ncbi:MAG: signal peptidase I [Anaerolineae bacterium]
MSSFFVPDDRPDQETFHGPEGYPIPAPPAAPPSENPFPPEIELGPAPLPQPSVGAQILSVLREVLETVLLTLVIFFLIRFAVENYRVEGQSMEPNFHNGQYLLVNKISYLVGHPQRDDVIIFRYPLDESKNYIKRIIGLPGETVEIKSGRVYIDERLVPEAFPINHADYNWGPSVISPNQYFVLGDNRPESSDSHSWGLVPIRDIIGKTWLCYWPPDMWGLVPDYSSPTALPPFIVHLFHP